MWALPGQRFSARGGHEGPGFQHVSRMEMVLTLRDDPGLLLDPDRAPDLGMLRRPLSDLEPRLSAGEWVCFGLRLDVPGGFGGSGGWAAASSRSSLASKS